MSKPEKPKNLQKKKLKYISRKQHRDSEIIDIPGMLPTSKNGQAKQIDIESSLRCPQLHNGNKTNMVLDTDDKNKDKDYRNFRLMDDSNNRGDTSFYYTGGYKGAGRGFGNIDDNMSLRYSKDTRQDNTNISNIEINRFQKLFRNYQNADNLVLPFPRGGIDTRNLDKYSKEK